MTPSFDVDVQEVATCCYELHDARHVTEGVKSLKIQMWKAVARCPSIRFVESRTGCVGFIAAARNVFDANRGDERRAASADAARLGGSRGHGRVTKRVDARLAK